MPPRRPLLLLSLVHVTVGMLAAFLSADGPATSSAIFLAIVFCHTALVGMWGGLGAGHWMLRLFGVTAGTTYIAVQLGLGIGELEPEIFLLVIQSTILVSAVTWIARLFNGRIQRISRGRSEVRKRLQFSVRHLMGLTFFVASMILLGKVLVPYLYPLRGDAMVLSVLACCYAVVALAGIWAIMGRGRVWDRMILAGVVAVMAGIMGGYVVNRGTDVGFWVSTTLLQAVLLVGSLWVVRTAGYGFAPKPLSWKHITRDAPACQAMSEST